MVFDIFQELLVLYMWRNFLNFESSKEKWGEMNGEDQNGNQEYEEALYLVVHEIFHGDTLRNKVTFVVDKKQTTQERRKKKGGL